jgi:SpoVK/Ycf46/Vps4 family AAA+-type ATPase
LRLAQGVLLYGPPGTGKTMLAKALAKESNACFINVRAAALQSKWFGDAQKLVTAVFTLAWKIQPCIIFIDEIDSFLGTRKSNEHEAVTSMKTEFMSLWDGFITDNDARVMVLAATNRPWDIDEAILRRLPRAFEVPLPDARQRQRILSVLLRGEDVDETLWADEEEEEGEEGDATEHGVGGGSVLAEIAAATEGYSGSDLQDLCKQAALLPIHDLLEEEDSAAASGRPMRRDAPRPLTAEDLFTVLEVRAALLCATEMKAADSLHAATERTSPRCRGRSSLSAQREYESRCTGVRRRGGGC